MPGKCLRQLRRRTVLQTLGLAGVVGTSGCSTLLGEDQSDGSQDWPMFGFDTRNSSAPPATSGPTDGVAVQWKFEPESHYDGVGHPPAVVGGTVYVGGDRVYALNAGTGKEEWRFELGLEVTGSPAVVDGTVYFGTEKPSLYALDAVSGEQQWRFAPDEEFMKPSAPAVVDGTVYTVGAGASAYAVDAASGEELWRVVDIRGSAPAVVDGTVYTGSSDNNVYALDAGTGEEEWRFATVDSTDFSDPAVVDGTVYIGSNDHHVYALDAASGEEQWRFETHSRADSSPAVADGIVYVGSDRHVHALDAASGQQQWRFDHDTSSPVVVNSTVYLGMGGVYALTEPWWHEWLNLG